MNNNNFYCQRMVGDENFSIKEWNETFHALEKTNMTEREKDEILNPEVLGTCEKQCFDCMASVGSRRIETQALIDKHKPKVLIIQRVSQCNEPVCKSCGCDSYTKTIGGKLICQRCSEPWQTCG